MVQLAEFQRAFSEDRATPERTTLRFSPPRDRPSSSRLSPFVGSYSDCNSIDELCDRFTRYHRQVRDMVSTMGTMQIDDETRTMITQQTNSRAALQFHSIHGENLNILKNGKKAKRNESFCKGLAFSNRPIAVNEIVCILLAEVNTNWSGVLRFGVTNDNPTVYEDTPVPPFACPDLTTKEGNWAKALPERYSAEGNILHFYVNHSGELFYGINGSQKGMFLTGINVSRQMWVLLDIYGNSVAVEYIDSSEFRPRRNAPPPPAIAAPPRPPPALPPSYSSAGTDGTRHESPYQLSFHHVTGRNIKLGGFRKNIATRNPTEYYQAYVFTKNPLVDNEKFKIKICEVQPLYSGGLAFGVTCCAPDDIKPWMLRDDSADLVENPDYWVTIKNLVPNPRVGMILSFWLTEAGEIKFEIDELGARTVLHVDNSLRLYMFFDLFGNTSKIEAIGCFPILPDSSEPETREVTEQPLSIPRRPARLLDTSASRSSFGSGTDDAFDYVSSLSGFTRPVPPRESTAFGNGSRSALSQTGLADGLRPTSSHSGFSSRPTSSESVSPLRVDISRPSRSSRPDVPPVAPRSSTTTSVISSPPDFSPPPLPQEAQPSSSTGNSSGSGLGNVDLGDECSICMDAVVNSVLYTCGHMCMCDTCARHLLQTKGTCPICRAVVKDVVKIYRA